MDWDFVVVVGHAAFKQAPPRKSGCLTSPRTHQCDQPPKATPACSVLMMLLLLSSAVATAFCCFSVATTSAGLLLLLELDLARHPGEAADSPMLASHSNQPPI